MYSITVIKLHYIFITTLNFSLTRLQVALAFPMIVDLTRLQVALALPTFARGLFIKFTKFIAGT